ncbi:KilA domain protein [Desulfofarcimen acetoxidans DSM 771]|uniref:KilA domain protein n=1 Tax=Desulfofarcimen acetoxidans (strain ATCC 49208 / DSM 771 / KCTC 5769 / VKM B-1644 / 5575) TaxID=485916 RepID=C8VXI5_DESAS|nr:KilA domain protein [Desulfofarcimen acetoxidans DSM 771]
MLTEEERAEAIWTYCIAREKVLKRLVEKNIMPQYLADTLSERMLEQLNVNDIPGFRRSSVGEAMIAKRIQIAFPDNTYMSLTEIARQKDTEVPSYVIQSWLRNYGTIEFLRLWEKESNPKFVDEECTALIERMKSSSFTLTLKQWIANTGAVGITSKQGKNGGTFAHPDIACEFSMWIDPAYRLDVVKKFRMASIEK